MRRTPHELTLEARGDDAPAEYTFETADGVHSPEAFRDAELLLANALWEESPGSLLVVQANYGVVGTLLAPVADGVEMAESSARAAGLCERNAAANTAEDAGVTLTADPGSLDAAFDSVACAPKPYTSLDVGKQRLANALALLDPGGSLYLAASEQAGLARYEDALDGLAARVETLDEWGGCHLLEATAPERVDPPTYVEPRTIHATVEGVELALVTVPGVFSASALDHGTRLLLETATVADGDRVLDLCCGYGAVGAYAASAADCGVWLTDDDRLATRCAECTLDATGVDGTVVTADCLEGVADRTFDAVLSNPPTHAGDRVLRELFDGARDVLAPGGSFWLVHHRDLDLRPHLAAFDDVERVATGEEHVVLHAR